MYNLINKAKRVLKKYWIEGVLLICLLSAFSIPIINISVLIIAIGILIGRLIIKNRKINK
jgi:hypothetical protein